MQDRSKGARIRFFLGVGLMAVGVIINEWTLTALFSPDGMLEPLTRQKILYFNLFCIIAGLFLIFLWPAAVQRCRFVISVFSSRKETIFKLICVFLSFLLAEILIRATGWYEDYNEKVGGEYVSAYNQPIQTPWIDDHGVNKTYSFGRPEFDFEVRTNSEGVRDIERPIEKPEDEYRIITLGDSFTMGFGAEFRDSYPKVLERNLSEHSSSKKVRVICGGVTGSDPVYSYQLLKRRLIKYEPNLVILLINVTDIGDLISRGGLDRFGADGIIRGVKAPKSEWLFEYSHLVRAVMITFLRYNWYLLRPEKWAEKTYLTIPVIVEVAETLKAYGEKEGFDFLLVTQPQSWEFVEREVPGFTKRLEAELAKKEIEYADLTHFFYAELKQDRISKYAWPVDGHYNAKGYDLLARAVEKVLRRRFADRQYPWSNGSPIESGTISDSNGGSSERFP